MISEFEVFTELSILLSVDYIVGAFYGSPLVPFLGVLDVVVLVALGRPFIVAGLAFGSGAFVGGAFVPVPVVGFCLVPVPLTAGLLTTGVGLFLASPLGVVVVEFFFGSGVFVGDPTASVAFGWVGLGGSLSPPFFPPLPAFILDFGLIISNV